MEFVAFAENISTIETAFYGGFGLLSTDYCKSIAGSYHIDNGSIINDESKPLKTPG